MFNEIGVGISFPLEIWGEVIKYSKSHLTLIACVNKQLKELAINYFKNNPCKEFIGENKWKLFGVDTGVLPPISLKAIEDFDAEKEIFTLIPKTINNVLLSLNCLRLFLKEFGVNFVNLARIDEDKVSNVDAHFVILSKNVIDGSRGRLFKTQNKLVKLQGFEIPNLLDVIVSVSLYNIMNPRICLYSDQFKNSLCTYTRVQEKNNVGARLIVGGYSNCGLVIRVDTYFHIRIGAAYSKKIPLGFL